MIYLFIKIGFLDITIIDIIDILLMALILFQLYRLIRGSLAYNIFFGLLVIYILSLIAKALDMKLMGEILGQFIGVGVIALLIVFQPEVRRFLLYVGRSSDFRKIDFWRRLTFSKIKAGELNQKEVLEITGALINLSNIKTGALLVFPESSKLQFYQNTGITVNAFVSKELIETIFQKTSPLHDGALIISDHKIAAAKCVLNVSENPNLPFNIGMRHRSAVGITEVSDAHAIIVSEENGEISYAKEGKLKQNISEQELKKILSRVLFKTTG
ncbi:MAG: TIGR00159 family protein [Fimbriimonadaceae bacterium]|nr:TIGR00159 family protein [Chitinophagales bacterium]